MKRFCKPNIYAFLESLDKPAEFSYLENIIRHYELGSFSCPSRAKFSFSDTIYNFFNTLNGESCCNFGESMSKSDFSITSKNNMRRIFFLNKGLDNRNFKNIKPTNYFGLEIPPFSVFTSEDSAQYHEILAVLLNYDLGLKYTKSNLVLLLSQILKLLKLSSSTIPINDFNKIFKEFDIETNKVYFDNSGILSTSGYKSLYYLLLSLIRSRELKLPISLHSIEDFTNHYIYSTEIEQNNINEFMSTPSVKEITIHIYEQLKYI